MGTVDTGKTYFATVIALKSCQEGRRVRFFTAALIDRLIHHSPRDMTDEIRRKNTLLTLLFPWPVDYLCMIKQFPCKALAATVTVAHIFPFQQAVTARADRIAVPAAKYHYLYNRKRNTVGKRMKKGGLTWPLL